MVSYFYRFQNVKSALYSFFFFFRMQLTFFYLNSVKPCWLYFMHLYIIGFNLGKFVKNFASRLVAYQFSFHKIAFSWVISICIHFNAYSNKFCFRYAISIIVFLFVSSVLLFLFPLLD